MSADAQLDRLAGAWRAPVGTATRQALLGLLALALLGGAHVARLGTPVARAAVAAAVALDILALVVRWLRDRRDYRDPRRTIRRVLFPTDRQHGERTLRALGLAERTGSGDDAGSAELARLHLTRLLERASVVAVAERASRRASHTRRVALALLAGGLVALAAGPMHVIEGLDVLVARGGRGPLPMLWLDFPHVTAQPPSYLREPARTLLPGEPSSLPQGTLLTVSGVPMRDGRTLVLGDGSREVPFVRDGSGGVVAHWTLAATADLRVAARFGTVLVEEPEALSLRAEPDEAPRVSLGVRSASGTVDLAPRSLSLGEIQRIELEYEASDDHGLRQIEVVLRVGSHEERRPLARLDGTTLLERGGYALDSRDAALRRAFLPTVLVVEARDNEPLRGGLKWGKSEAITLLPAVVGAEEAARFAAFVVARDALVDLLGARFAAQSAVRDPKQPALRFDARERTRAAAAKLRSALDGSYGGLGVPRRLRAFALGQLRRLERGERGAVPGSASPTRTAEDVVLALDVAMAQLASSDARSVARRLGDVADEAASAAHFGRESEKSEIAHRRLDDALAALDAGSERLSMIGTLGSDLGGVARAGIGRIRRARKAEDLGAAELASQHLAARLRRPSPSFATARAGGVESGSPQGGEASGVASSADRRFDQLADELQELARDHAGAVGKTEQALAEAERSTDLGGLADDARQHAAALRRALSDLPLSGGEPESARASASQGREQGEAMAHALERLELKDAVESGRSSRSALGQARQKLKRPGSDDPWLDAETLRAAEDVLRTELAWAERRLAELKKGAEQRAKGALADGAEREREHARRAGNLASRGKLGESALPDDAVDALERAERAMHEAARDLALGHGERALAEQRAAQRLLESLESDGDTDHGERRRRPPKGVPAPPAERLHDDGARGLSTGGEVPRTDEKGGAEAFRKRVVDGLSRSQGGRFGAAVRRYADGLLR